jgi:hypothetical protein
LSESPRAAPISSGRGMPACRPADAGGNEIFTAAASLEICQRDQASRLRAAHATWLGRRDKAIGLANAQFFVLARSAI